MPRIEFPGFCAPHYDYGTLTLAGYALDRSNCMNLYPETAQQFGRQRHYLIGRPGMQAYTTLANSPVRGLFTDARGVLYAVGGTHLYQIASGPTITDLGAMPSSAGAQPCLFAQMGAGNAAVNSRVMVCDTGVSKLYYYNGSSMVSPFNASYIDYLDGFMVAIATGASLQNSNQPNQINVSAFGDLTNWTPGPGATQAFAVRTGSSDLINALAVLNGYLWVFGQKTIEIWFNAGLSPFPFQRVQGATINLGCIAPQSVVKFNNTIVWLGQDQTGFPQVYMAKGLSPVKVSDPAIESFMISQTSGVGNGYLANAWAYGYQEAGHTFWCLNFYNGILIQNTAVVYDLTEGVWHTRSYGGVQPIAFANSPLLNTPGISTFIGSFASAQILLQDLRLPVDLTTGGAATNIAYQRTAPYVSDLSKVSRHGRFEVIGNFGINTPTLSLSDDFGQTFRQNYSLNGPGSDQGWQSAIGLQRWYAQQLGRSRARVYQLGITGTDHSNPVRIAGAYLDVDAGAGQ